MKPPIGESGVMPDNAVVANRATVGIFHYPVAIATWNCSSAILHSGLGISILQFENFKNKVNHNFDFLFEI